MSAPIKILIVDDEPDMRQTVGRFLRGVGYVTVECADGDEALVLVPKENPALIILDVEMPRLSGWETITLLRRSGCRVPVLMLTSHRDVDSRVKGLGAGADDYLGKPCDVRELLARVEALLRRSQSFAAEPRVLRFGKITVDLERKLAKRGDERLTLTRKEFAMLELFARQSGKPVTREAMLEQIWGYSPERTSTKTIDTHIWRLRKKLADDDRSRWIRNLAGIGYVMTSEPEPEKTPAISG